MSRNRVILVILILVALAVMFLGVGFIAYKAVNTPEVRRTVGLFESVMTPGFVVEARRQKELNKLRDAGEPVTLEEAVPPQVPDEANAALIYQQAFEALSLTKDDQETIRCLLASVDPNLRGPVYVGEIPMPTGPEVPSLPQDPELWQALCSEPPPLAELESVVQKNAKALRLVEKAAPMRRCRFPANWEAGFEATFPHFGKIRACVQLCCVELYVQAQQGQTQHALQTARIGLVCGRSVRDEPTIIAALLTHACYYLILNSLQGGLTDQQVSEGACQHLFDYLASFDPQEDFRQTLLGDRAFTIYSSEKSIQDQPAGKHMIRWNEVAYLRFMEKYIPQVSRLYRQTPDLPTQIAKWSEEYLTGAIMADLFVPLVGGTGLQIKRDRAIAQVALCQAALALNAYHNRLGKYPDSLDQLREVIPWELREDPFSGDDLKYQREGEGFLLWSLGPDLKDDNGTPLDQRQGERPFPGDIIWRAES